MAVLVDTHCHIDLEAFADDRIAVIERAHAAGVDQMILIGFAPERWETGGALCAQHRELHLATGLHPTEAEEFDDALEQALRQAAHELNAVAIGETGLDYHWKADSAAKQRDVFARQIGLAKELDLPFIVHQRDAERDTLDVLGATEPPHRGVMHCFTGDSDYARRCLDLGLHIGIGGAVTFRKLKALHEAVGSIPLDRMLLETDAPYMTPSPHRGQRNEPAYVRYVLDKIAELRDIASHELANVTTRNAVNLFRLPSVEHDDERADFAEGI
ncbi:MAG TPA: TatD family hydrolase [Nitrolancea sp.]|nr:TatD family hydrolase [Nitrolancea sp.]